MKRAADETLSEPRPRTPPYPKLGGPGILDGFLHAWKGLIHTVVYQRNMRTHVVSALMVGLVGSGIPLGLAEKVTLIFCVLFVFFAEILNTALEQIVDLAIQQFDEKARIAKDAAAAGVLVLAVGTVVVFAAILVHNWETVARSGPQIARQVMLGLPLVACSALLLTAAHKPLWLDIALFAAATALMVALSLRTESLVFSALTYGQVLVAFASAVERQKLSQASPRNEKARP
jgi:diacylglycerol kinase (ATP)